MAWLFQGGEHGDVELSFYVTAMAPGRGPGLHLHPYPEVFLVEEGAGFTAGDEEIEVASGSVVVVPAETPHRFVNAGEGTLRVVSIHPTREVVTTWLDG